MVSEEEAIEEIEVQPYSVASPDLLETMLDVTELLEKVARGELTFNEAKAIYAESILPKLNEIEEKRAAKKTRKKTKKASSSSKKTGSSSKSKKRKKRKKEG